MRVAQGNQTPMRIIRPEGRGQLGKQLGEGRAWAPRAPLLLTAPTPCASSTCKALPSDRHCAVQRPTLPAPLCSREGATQPRGLCRP